MSDIIPARNIWDHWAMPNDPPRETQITTLDWMAELPAKAKYIFLQVPVGGGKSPIAISYASFLGNKTFGSSYILTPQRILQKQYEDSFIDQNLIAVYGKANYMCTTKLGLNCDIGNDIKPACPTCPSKEAFQRIANTPHVALSYKLGLLYSELFPGTSMDFPVKDLMVFDECHTLENNLVSHRAVNVNTRRCDSMKLSFFRPSSLKEAHDWLIETYYPAVCDRFGDLEIMVKEIDNKYEFSPGSLLPSEIRTKNDFKDITRHRVLVRNLVNKNFATVEEFYVLMVDKNMFQFKEIFGANLFHHILEPKANRFLFMSSTILNFKSYATDLGIPVDESATISLPSEFKKENRPVYFIPTSKMTYGWDKPVNAPLRTKMVDKVIMLMDAHKEKSGIIHTGSFNIAKWLIGELQGRVSHNIITHDPEDNGSRDDCIAEFTDNKGKVPTILISPSCTEGLDLTGNTARFAIFVKVPYPYLGDEWVKRRLDLSNEWYQRQAMTGIIQGGGRIVRSHDDWGNTYILDSAFSKLWAQFKGLTPEWWKDAFSVIE